ncbi:Cu-oxidase-domain-containing protein [Neoconidiobolus thromboides FSU 785]|nr:Cu-oxidase-domain-containing protein [Neoconidiobolus thromboides FSU 785]
MLSELWHKPSDELLKGLLSVPFRFVGPSDSILTNGMTYKVWDNAGANNSTVPFNNGYNVINVKPNKRYRLRLIAANGLSFLSFRIPGHKFTLIEADGTIIEPVEVDHIEMTPGQRYSVIMETNQQVDNYYAYTQVTGGSVTPNNGVAILHYDGAESADALKRISTTPPTPTGPFNRWVESQLFTSKWYNKGLSSHYYPVPKKATKEIMLNVISSSNEGLPIFTVNDVIVKPRNTTIWDDVISGRHKPTPGIYEITEGDEIQLIVQHLTSPGRACASHPWHLHGHSFFVVGHGSDVYNPEVDRKVIDTNLNNPSKIPIYRDTFIQYANNVQTSAKSASHQLSDTLGVKVNNENSNEIFHNFGNSRAASESVPCGWYAIRFKADNPGSWYMHCHITAHLVMGKQLVINESPKK